MSLALLDRTLQTVPFLSALGIRAEETQTGHVVLRLPYSPSITNHVGAIHTAAVFAVGELAAAVVLGTHPKLAGLIHLQKSSKVKYYLPCSKDITAHATVTEENMASILRGIESGHASTEIVVKVLDGHGNDVAELTSHFAFRSR